MVDRDGSPLNAASPVLRWVVCPACRGELALAPRRGADGLACAGCGRWYPVVDDVPYLVEEYAERPEPTELGAGSVDR